MRPIPALPRSLLRSCQLELISAAADKSLQSCPSLCDPIDGNPPGSSVPGFLDKNTGVGCHFFLQCVKVKSESKVAQSCLTLSNPMDCSPPGSSIHGIFQARVLELGAIAFSRNYLYSSFILFFLKFLYYLSWKLCDTLERAWILELGSDGS